MYRIDNSMKTVMNRLSKMSSIDLVVASYPFLPAAMSHFILRSSPGLILSGLSFRGH